MKKDAKYYCEEGVKRYKKGSKSALKSFQKALELALNDPSTPNELLKSYLIIQNVMKFSISLLKIMNQIVL